MAICGGVTPLLECAFGVEALAEPTSGEWVNLVAADVVRSIEVTRGTRPVRDEPQVGHLKAVLLNTSGDLDPDNTGGAYYPDLREDLHIRLRGTVSATTKPRFRGHVGSILPYYPRGRKPYTVIDAYDPLWLAARHNLDTVGFARRVLEWSPAPTAFWRLGDRDTATTAYDETGNRRFATHGLGARVGADGLLTADRDRATALGGDRVVIGTRGAGLTGTDHGLFMLVRPSSLAASEVLFTQVLGPEELTIRLLSSGLVRLTIGAGVTAETVYPLIAGAAAAVGLRRSGSSWTLGVDNGDGLETVSATYATAATASWPVVGGQRSDPTFAPSFGGEVDEVVIWAAADPGASMLQTLASLALRPGYGETPVERFAAIADLFGFPSSRLSASYDLYYESVSPLGAWPDDPGSHALDAYRRLARSATADIWATSDGLLSFAGYEFPTGTATPLATFTDQDSADIPCRSIVPGRRQRRIRTKVEVSDGSRSVTMDATGSRAESDINLNVYPGLTDDLPADVAQRTVREAEAGKTHVEELEVPLLALSDSQRLTVLDLDLYDPIAVEIEGRTLTQEVTYIKETVTPSTWDVEMAARPLRSPYVPAVRATYSAHESMGNGTTAEPSIPGEQFDNDAGHLGIVTDTGVALQNDVYHRDGDLYLVFAQTWWAGNATGARRSRLRDGGSSTILGLVTDAGDGQGNAQQIVTLRQAGTPGPGDPVESTALEVIQQSGGPLDLFASVLGDADWHFAPVIGQVRIPTGRHAARAVRSSALSPAHDTETTINFDGADRFDVGGMHDPASNSHRLTAQKAASFFVGAHVAFDLNGSGHRILSIRHQGATRIARAGTKGNGDAEAGLCTATVYKFGLGEWVDFQAYQSSGGALPLGTTQQYGMEAWAVELVHSARATMAAAPAAGAISSGNAAVLSWDTERWDDAGIFGPTSAFLTAAVDGPHVVGCNVEWLANANGSRRVEILLNDSIVIARREMLPFAATSTSMDCWTIWPDTQAGDTFSVRVYQDSGDNNLTLFKASNHAPEFWLGLIAAA